MDIKESNKLLAEFLGYKLGYYETYEDEGDEFNYSWTLRRKPILYKEESELVDNIIYSLHEQRDYKKHYKAYDPKLNYYLNYNSDWSELMQIVEKIETMDYGVKTCRKVVEIYIDSTKEVIISIKEKSKFESLYKAIVMFVEIYNQNK